MHTAEAESKAECEGWIDAINLAAGWGGEEGRREREGEVGEGLVGLREDVDVVRAKRGKGDKMGLLDGMERSDGGWSRSRVSPTEMLQSGLDARTPVLEDAPSKGGGGGERHPQGLSEEQLKMRLIELAGELQAAYVEKAKLLKLSGVEEAITAQTKPVKITVEPPSPHP